MTVSNQILDSLGVIVVDKNGVGMKDADAGEIVRALHDTAPYVREVKMLLYVLADLQSGTVYGVFSSISNAEKTRNSDLIKDGLIKDGLIFEYELDRLNDDGKMVG